MKHAAFVRKLPPCPVHDRHRFTCWLESMAAEGMRIVRWNSLIPMAVFYRGERQLLRFRLIPLEKLPTLLTPQDTPPEELTNLAAYYGWKYLFRCSSFYLFCTDDPQARELDTDPEIQRQAALVLHRLELRSFLTFLLTQVFLWAILLPDFCWNMVSQGSVLLLSLLLCTLLVAVQQVHALLCLRRSARNQTSSIRDRHSGGYRFSQILLWGLILILLISWCGWKMADLGLGARPLEEYPGTVPFVTLEDLSPQEPEVLLEHLHHIDNAYWQSRPDPLFRDALYWMDVGGAAYPDGSFAGGFLELHYCRTLPWLAEAAAKDYLQFNRHRYASGWEEFPQLGLDYAAGYITEFGITRMVLVQDGTLVCVYLSMGDPYGNFTLEHWTELMAARLLS